MSKEYIIYCDESEERGRHYSNFYGGALIRSDHIDDVRNAISHKKEELNLGKEVKWNKITYAYKEKYKELIDFYFDYVKEDIIKIRIMFTDNRFVPNNLTQEHIDEKYFILYYQFLKHAFGLTWSPDTRGGVDLRIHLDKMPDTREQVEKFKGFVHSLQSNADFRRKRIRIRQENITEVVSHDHNILQCLDIVLGAIHFRLNDKHLAKEPGERFRRKRTRAKEYVYRHINSRIRDIYPNFNIGISTGHRGDWSTQWADQYRHWLFKPTDHTHKPGSKKKK